MDPQENEDYQMETFNKMYMDYKASLCDSMDDVEEMDINYKITEIKTRKTKRKLEKDDDETHEVIQAKRPKYDTDNNQETDTNTTNEGASRSNTSLAYDLYIYREEIARRKPNALDLTQMKIDITFKMIMSCAGRISQCSEADIDAFIRMLTFKDWLVEQK